MHALTESPFQTDDDVQTLLTAFHHSVLPRSAWNHQAHMTVALSIGRAHAPDVALTSMREAINRFNAAVGIVSTPDYGYHETITAFYMHAVALHIRGHPRPTSAAEDANAFMSEWGRPDLPLDFYSKERLFSREARAAFVSPDLQQLPDT
ncbi:MAG: hypothetical protein H7099_19855 [Gemmatimonadaceae bacterium]|nr:hypothetical protein [Gemmatimonadaceae bacterium]